MKNKQSGHKRTDPQSASQVQTEQNINVNLGAEMENLKVSGTFCNKCKEDFETQIVYNIHMKTKHSTQWNCNQCAFQASTRDILMKHCKLTPGHHPTKQRLGQAGVMECYTCKGEFRSYHDLMNQRKEENPSHKKCRYFLKGECHFSSDECWYLHENKHEEISGVEDTQDNIQCFVCKSNFGSKYDLLEHKKKQYPSKGSHKKKTIESVSMLIPRKNNH